MNETKARSLVKAFSWRFFASLITGLIVLVLTRENHLALGAMVVDAIVKIVVYYIHERIWIVIPYGKIRE